MGRYGNHRDSESRSDFRRLNVILLIAAAIIPLALFVGGWRHVSRIGQSGGSAVAEAAAKLHDDGAGSRTNSGLNVGIPLVTTAIQSSPVFPFSVIAGGAHSGAELKNAVLQDPVVAAHYAGFDVARTRVIRTSRAEEVYVSYRIGDRVYWTSKRLYIPAGETLLSDGEHEARTRCGNRLSETPQLPVSAKEPLAEVLNGPAIPVASPSVAEVLPALALVRPEMGWGEIVGDNPVEGRAFDPPSVPIVGGPGVPPLEPSKNPPPSNPDPPVGPPPSPPIAAAPEPPSGLLFLLSGGFLGVFGLRRKIHQ